MRIDPEIDGPDNSVVEIDAVGLPIGPGSDLAKRAEFARHHLWVTRYDPKQIHAAGDYPNQHPGDGIGAWVTQERDLVNTDVVVWHTFGTSHLPRPEDWPIMPCDYVGFTLKPVGLLRPQSGS